MKYPQGSYATKGGETRKVLGTAGEVRFLECDDDVLGMLIKTVKGLEEEGWEEKPMPANPTGRFWEINFVAVTMCSDGKRLDNEKLIPELHKVRDMLRDEWEPFSIVEREDGKVHWYFKRPKRIAQ